MQFDSFELGDLCLTMQLVVMISDIDDVIVVKMRFALETVD